jgi:hypothetical protein
MAKKSIYTSDTVKGQVKSKSDKEINKAGQAYNMAKTQVALQQQKKENDQQSEMTMMQQMMLAQKEQQLMDMMAQLDLQQKLMQNTMKAQPEIMAPFMQPQDMGTAMQAGGSLPSPDAMGGAPAGMPMPPQGMPPEMMQQNPVPPANGNLIPLA